MNEQELRMQGVVSELETQRSWALTRCAELFAQTVILNQKIADLEAKELTPKESP